MVYPGDGRLSTGRIDKAGTDPQTGQTRPGRMQTGAPIATCRFRDARYCDHVLMVTSMKAQVKYKKKDRER
jgi:hypothetical protein